MFMQNSGSMLKPAFAMLRIAALNTLVMTAPILAVAGDSVHDHSPSTLVQIVRANTAQFINVNNLQGTGYAPLFGCVSGPDHGAMGIHYLNLGLVGDGMLDERYPEALIYEPVGNARRLVGVEYIVDAATWLAAHDNAPPHLRARISSLLMLRTGLEFRRFSNCMFGLGEIIRTAHSLTGTTT